jgi:hypothetical protein
LDLLCTLLELGKLLRAGVWVEGDDRMGAVSVVIGWCGEVTCGCHVLVGWLLAALIGGARDSIFTNYPERLRFFLMKVRAYKRRAHARSRVSEDRGTRSCCVHSGCAWSGWRYGRWWEEDVAERLIAAAVEEDCVLSDRGAERTAYGDPG